jgi:hypothetical protein
MNQGGGVTVREASHKACVIYHSRSGKVRHIHEVITLEGGTEPNRQAIEKAAFHALDLRGGRDSAFKALHVEGAALRPQARYEVDLDRESLREIDITPRVREPTK